MLHCRSEPCQLSQTAKQTSSGWVFTTKCLQTACRPCTAEHSCLDQICTLNPSPFRLACVLQDAGHAQSSRPSSWKAYRPCTRTCCSAQQRYSSDQHYNSGHHSSSHQPRCSDQDRGIGQQQGPDISLLSPVLQRQWDHANNAHLGDIVVKPYARRRVWWGCNQCPDGHPHVWEAPVFSRSSGSSCPFCANKRVCQHNSLATKYPDIAAEFSDRNQGTAHDYTSGSGKEVCWQCNHGHEYSASINDRTTNKTGCPECFASRNSSQPRQKHPVLTDSPRPIMQFWDSELNAREGLNPKLIRCRSRQLCNWICHSCPKGQPHRWQARPGTLYLGHGCPCCSGHKACTCNSLQSLFPEVAAEWDYNRNLGTPADYTAGSNRKVWWYNDKRGGFQASITSRTFVRKVPEI